MKCLIFKNDFRRVVSICLIGIRILMSESSCLLSFCQLKNDAAAELFFRSKKVEMWQERGYLEMSHVHGGSDSTLWPDWLRDFCKSLI